MTVPARAVVRRVFGAPEARDPADTSTGPGSPDAGRAIIEVIFGAVLLLIPTIYVLITLFKFQAATFAVTQAARDVGRLISTNYPRGSMAQLQQVAEVALTDQQLSAQSVVISFTPPGASCTTGTSTLPYLPPDARYDICVTAVVDLPGVPSVLGGSRNTVTGVYSLHINHYVEGG